MTTIKSPNTAKEERNHPFGMIPLRIPITTRGTDRMGIRTGFKIVKNELICPKLLDIPKESRTFALLESATLPVEQRTRAELFLYIRFGLYKFPFYNSRKHKHLKTARFFRKSLAVFR